MNAKLLFLCAIFIFCSNELMSEVTLDIGQSINEFQKQVSEASDQKIAKIVISPFKYVDRNALNVAGYGEIESNESAKILSKLKSEKFKILSVSPGGVIVNLTLLFKNRGFEEKDKWVCKIFPDKVLILRQIPPNRRYYIQLPDELAKIVLENFITKFE
jgi:hypothetical protein